MAGGLISRMAYVVVVVVVVVELYLNSPNSQVLLPSR